MDAQQAVESEAVSWGKIWQQGVCGQDPKWPDDMGQQLPALAVCATVSNGVGLGWDKLHPKALARCSDAVLESLVRLLMLAVKVSGCC